MTNVFVFITFCFVLLVSSCLNSSKFKAQIRPAMAEQGSDPIFFYLLLFFFKSMRVSY